MSDPPLMDLHVSPDASPPLFAQVYESLRARIAEGVLPAGRKLPASRKLAEDLGVSRTTIVNAYDQLIAEGFAVGRPGSGVYVSDIGEVEREPARTAHHGDASGPVHAGRRQPAADPAQAIKPFWPGQADMRLFPFRPWARCFARIARTRPEALVLAGDPFGDYELRTQICRYLAEWRSLAATPEQVMITAGSGDALEKCLHSLAGPGDTVGLEDPGYPPLRRFVRGLGLRPTWLAVDGSGAVPPARTADGPAMVMLTPSSQFPLGGAMPRARRNEFLVWAAEHDAWIVEDDYDSEFRYAGQPISALAGLDRHGRTLYIGSFAKVFSTGLRLGFLVIPPALVHRFSAALHRARPTASATPQRPLALFMENGAFYRHLRRMRRIYRDRRNALMALLNQYLANHVTYRDHRAGMHIAAILPDARDDRRIAAAAAARGIVCQALSAHYATPPRRSGLLLGFCGFTPAEMEAPMAGLRALLDQTAGHGGRRKG